MTVSFVVFAYNEEKTLPKLLECLEQQDYPHKKIEVLLIDSMSTDRTREIMEQFAASHPDFLRILLLQNPKKTQPCGCNVALKNYQGDAFVRIDAHAWIPPDFLSRNVRILERGEMACGGQRPNMIDGDTPWKRTLLAAEQSMFGSSIASYRRSTHAQYTSSLFHGMYRREVFEKAGFYNELLTRTEDNDMSYRIRKAGYRLYYDPSIVSYQHTRSTLRGMLRQKYLNAYWIGRTMAINPRCISLFHFVPFVFLLGILFTTVLALCGFPLTAWLMWGAYALLTLVMTVPELVRRPFTPTNLLLPFLFLLLHITYGIGTLIGLAAIPFRMRRGNAA